MIKALKKLHWRLLFPAVALLLYIGIGFTNLGHYPNYFFCDEAIVGVEAKSLIDTGRDQYGVPFPIFFQGLGQFQQSLAVYLEIPAIALLGLNEFAIRLTMALLGLFGVICSYFLLRKFFIGFAAWLLFPAMLFSPFWFLHARTGFEVLPAISFFCIFLCCYLLAFDKKQVRWAVAAATAAAMCFYCYIPARGWIAGTLLLLVLGKPKESWQAKRILGWGGLVFFLLLIPYLYFQYQHPEHAFSRLQAIGWDRVSAYPWSWKINQVTGNYAKAFNPLNWFTLHSMTRIIEGERHLIPGLPHLFIGLFPFLPIGFFLMIRKIRQRKYWMLLAVLLAAPLPSALFDFSVLRGMPVGVVFVWISLIGLGWLLLKLERWRGVACFTHSLLLAGVLLYGLWFHHHVFSVAPISYRNYGFYGVQYGAPQVFSWIREHERQYRRILLHHFIFNRGGSFRPFYLSKRAQRKVEVFDEKWICDRPRKVSHKKTALIVTQEGFSKIQSLQCPIRIRTLGQILDPRGNPLFVFFKYTPESEFEEWKQRRIENRSGSPLQRM